MERFTNTELKYRTARNADEAGEMRSELKQSPYETTFTGMVLCKSVRDSFLPAARKQVIGRQG